jgi:hypothetical protein
VTREIGWREWVTLPELGIDAIKAKVDTGARTSALHAFHVEEIGTSDGLPVIRFGVHPVQRDARREIWCESPVVDVRTVRDSGGHEERRYVIRTRLEVGDFVKSIELTLTDRDNMGFRMLIGRTAVRSRFVVNPGRSYLVGPRLGPARKGQR